MLRHLLAEGEVDPVGVVDEEPQNLFARLLERDEIKLGVEFAKLPLDVLLKILHLGEAVKKVGQAHFGYIGTY